MTRDEMQRLRRAEKEAEELERMTRRMWILSMVWAALTTAALGAVALGAVLVWWK